MKHRAGVHRRRTVPTAVPLLMAAVIVWVGQAQPAAAPVGGYQFNADAQLDTSQVEGR